MRLARWTALLLLLAFGWRVSGAFLSPCNEGRAPGRSTHGAVVAHHQSASADGCCPQQQASHPVDEPDDDGNCSCPIHCGSGCEGAVMHALPPDLPTIELGFEELVMLSADECSSVRRDAAPRGIIHVPRRS